MSNIGITTNESKWDFQNNYVERLMDNAALTSAHPDDTLVLAGPARLPTGNIADELLAIGMLQNFGVSQSLPSQPMMSIGSGRQFYVTGKAQTQWNMSRLFVNGRNLLRVLSTQAKAAGLDVSKFDEPASHEQNSKFFVNLDSELFKIPFGLAVMFRDKIHHQIGAFYIELCVINSWQINFAAGQSFMAEGVSGMADRILPMTISDTPKPSLGDPAFNDHLFSAKPSADNVLGLETSDPSEIYGDTDAK